MAGAFSTATVTVRLSTWSMLARTFASPSAGSGGAFSSSSFVVASASRKTASAFSGSVFFFAAFSSSSFFFFAAASSSGAAEGSSSSQPTRYPFSVGAITATSRSRRPVRFCRVYSSGPPRIFTGIGRVSSVS